MTNRLSREQHNQEIGNLEKNGKATKTNIKRHVLSRLIIRN